MKSTGPIETWNVNPSDVGPIYPFAGSEMVMFLICVACCAGFMLWKFVTETRDYERKSAELADSSHLEEILNDREKP